jgi:hypothetical protein
MDSLGSTTIKNLLLFDTGANGLQWAIHENANNDLEISYPSIKRGVFITSGTNGGMLGIGTSSIQGYSTLIVASATPAIDIMDNDAAAGSKHFVLANSQGVFTISTTSDTNTASTTFFTITNGNVGIGTSSPIANLAVAGSFAAGANFSVSSSGDVIQRGPEVDVRSYGAKCDGQINTNGNSSSNTTLTLADSTQGTFTSADVGKNIGITNWSGGVVVQTTITGFTNSTTVTVGVASDNTTANHVLTWGSDDALSINNAIQGLSGTGGIIKFPPGMCLVKSSIVLNRPSITLLGSGAYSTEDVGTIRDLRGTNIVWDGTVGSTTLIVSGISGAGNPNLKRVSVQSMSFRGNGMFAGGTGMALKGVQWSDFRDLYFMNYSTTSIDFNVLAASDEDRGVSRNTFQNITIRELDVAGGVGVGVTMDGDTTANANFNTFSNLQIFHNNSVGLKILNADSNIFDSVTIHRAGTGIGVDINGSNTTGLQARSNVFFSLSAGAGGLTARGAGLLFPSANNTVYYYNQENGEPNPVIETGAGLNWTSSSGLAFNTLMVKNTATSTNTFEIQNSAGLVVDNVNTNTVANLISNSGFETNTNGWTPKGVALVSFGNTSGTANFGTGSLKATTTAATTDGVRYMVPLKASQGYTFNVWAKVASGSVTGILGRQEINAVDIETSCSGFTITTTWTQFTCTFTTGATVSASTTNIYLRQTAAAANTIYMDGATLVTGAGSMTYDAGGNNFNIQSLGSILTLNGSNSGEIQPWQLASTTMPAQREDAATIVGNGYMYVIAGFDGTNRQNTTYYAKMNSDGSPGTWNTGTAITNNAAVAENRQYPGASTANGYVYIVGGFDGTQANSSILYSKLNSDGTVGTWYCQGLPTAAGCGTTSSPQNANGLPVAKVAPAVVVSNGFIYALGGCTDNAATCGTPSTVNYFAKLRADGSTGPWTSTGALAQARGMGAAVFENGSIVFVGGRNTTGTTTVDKSVVASDGSLATFSMTGMTALPANRQEHGVVVMNGYLYVMGGSDGAASPARQSTVYYGKLNADGSVNVWSTATNALPAGRSGATSIVANGYLYVLGGCALQTAGACGTNQANSSYFASGPRTLVGGGLDLIGLSSQSLSDFGGAGALSAGNGRFIGDLKVDGYADFNNGISVDSVININAVSADPTQPIFNINNSSSNSIFSVQHLATNFGSIANAGAFIDSNSMFDEEFNMPSNITAITADATTTIANTGYGLGDSGAFTFDTFTGTATTYSTPKSVVNGVARFTIPATSGVGFVFAMGQAVASYHGIYLKANLPVVQIKIKPSLVSAAEDIRFGLFDVATAASGTNDASTTNGIYFSNESGVSWQGVVRGSASALVGTTTCPGTISTTQFAVGRIVVESATAVRFYMDYDASNGTNFIDCGEVTGANPTVALTLGIMDTHTVASASTIDVDYMRTWQDDSASDNAISTLAVDEPQPLDIATSTEETDGTSTPPLIFNAEESYLSLASTTEKLDKRLASIEAMIATSTEATSTASTTMSLGGLNVSGHAVFNGGLIVGTLGQADLNMDMIGDVTFFGRPYFTGDTAGSAIVKKGAKIVTIKFDKDYIETPIVSATIALESASTSDALEESIFSSDIRYIVTRKDVHGFTILLNKPAPEDISFSWIALATKNQKLFTSRDEDILPAPVTTPSTPVADTPAATSTLPVIEIVPVVELASSTDATSTDATASSTEPTLVPEVIPEEIIIPPPSADTATDTATSTP